MKKTVRFLASVILFCMIFSPLSVSARSYPVNGTDVTVEIDDSFWYVFTRDNLKGNPELDELGLDYESFYSSMISQNIYVDACLFYDDGDYIELLVMVIKDENYVNLSNYNDAMAMVIGTATFTGYADEDDLTLYENDYKYIVAEYVDSELYLYQYLTIVNGYAYSFQFQSPYEFDDEKHQIAKDIMEDVTFAVDTSLEEKNLFGEALSNIIKWLAIGAAVVVVVVIAIVVIVVLVIRSGKKKQNAAAVPAATANTAENTVPAEPAKAEESERSEDEPNDP